MKRQRVLLALVLAFALTGVAGAQDGPWLATHYQPGNIAFSLDAGLSFSGGFGASAFPGAELILAKFRPGNVISLDVGLGAKGIFSFWGYANSDLGVISIGALPFASVHFGLRGFTGNEYANYLDRLDFFTGFGVGFASNVPVGNWGTAPTPGSGLAFGSLSGVNYYLTDSIAVSLNGNFVWGAVEAPVSVGIGVVYKIGPAEEIGERIDLGAIDDMTGDVMYASFAALYWSSVALGGYLPSDDTFEDGDGIHFRHTFVDDEGDVEEMEFTRALLHTNADGSQWWRFVFYDEEETFAYEALVGEDDAIERLRYADPETETVTTYTPDEPYLWQTYEDGEFWTSEDMDELRTGTERITVPAGTFRTDRLEASEEGYDYTWWISDEVPGRVVRYEGRSDEMENVSGELREILTNVTTPWDIPW
ncbi:MAG: hypothetical protein ACOC2Y_00040 [Spirochaetota bacterium]